MPVCLNVKQAVEITSQISSLNSTLANMPVQSNIHNIPSAASCLKRKVPELKEVCKQYAIKDIR